MKTRTRISLYTGKVSPCCNFEGCTDAQFAHGYCYGHQGRRRRKLAAQKAFYARAAKIEQTYKDA